MENVMVDAFTCRDFDQGEDNRDGWLSAKAGPAPTFSLSNAPVYNPEKATLGNGHGSGTDLNRYRELSHSDRSSSTQHSNLTWQNTNVPVLDIGIVETTYFNGTQNNNAKSPYLSPSCYSYTHMRSQSQSPHQNLHSIPLQPDNEVPIETPRGEMEPRIRVSLNQQCCVPGDTVKGTVFLDLPSELNTIGIERNAPQNNNENENDDESNNIDSNVSDSIKILVTFYGVEQVSLVGEYGEVVTRHHDCLTETKELVDFAGSVPEGMHEFQFGFDIPATAPPSCSVSLNNEGTGNIIYAVVATVEGALANNSLVCSSPVIIRELPGHMQQTGQGFPSPVSGHDSDQINKGVSYRTNTTGTNSTAISRMNSEASSGSKGSGKKPRSRRGMIRKILPLGRSHIRAKLQEDTVPFSGKIRIDFDEDEIKRNKRKKAVVKLIQKVELKADEAVAQNFDSILYVAEFEMGSIRTIELMLPLDNNELSPSVESQLVSCQYEIQIKTKSAFRILRRPVSLCLPVRLVSGE